MINQEDKKLFGLGRKPAVDERDRNFPMKAVLKTSTRTHRYWNANGYWGDQGNAPHCVGYAWSHWLEDGPITHGGVAPIVRPVLIYNEAQKIDEWPGENYDGTSVRAGAKFLQDNGFIKEYRWAWDLPTMIDAVLNNGPVVIGTPWYDSMFYPNSKGLVKISGDMAGGHATKADGVTVKDKLFRIKNNWSRNWGDKGHFWISFKDMERLIAEDSEICLAVEIKKK